MGSTLPDRPGDPHHYRAASVEVRETLFRVLGAQWGVKPETAAWKVYHLERGIRGQALDTIREIRRLQGQAAVYLWLTPIFNELNLPDATRDTDAQLGAKVEADSAENITLIAYLQDRSNAAARQQAIAALRKEGAQAFALADALQLEASHA